MMKIGLQWQSQWPHLNMVAVLLEAFQLRGEPAAAVGWLSTLVSGPSVFGRVYIKVVGI